VTECGTISETFVPKRTARKKQPSGVARLTATFLLLAMRAVRKRIAHTCCLSGEFDCGDEDVSGQDGVCFKLTPLESRCCNNRMHA